MLMLMIMRTCSFLLVLCMASVTWSASFVVNDGGADCPAGLTETHSTIQDAVDAVMAHADAMNDISICAGVYPEDIHLGNAPDKMITLKGVGDDHTTVLITGTGGGPGPIIDVHSVGTVNISQLTVDGQSAMVPTTMFGAVRGIRYEDTDGSISQVKVKNIGSADGLAQGLAIHIQGAKVDTYDPAMPPAEKRVEVVQNIIRNTARVGVLVDGYGVYAHIGGNAIEGPTMPPRFAFNGIQMSRGAKGQALENIIDDAVSPDPEAGGGAGVAMQCVSGIQVTKNTISNTDLGVVIIDSQSNTIANNVLQAITNGLDLQALGNFFGDLGCFSGPSPPQMNILNDNTIIDATSTGVQLLTFDMDIGVPSNNQFVNNVAIGEFFAFFVSSGEQNTFDSNLTLGSADFPSMSDQTAGSGTNGKANTYGGNFCDNPAPDQLCTGFGASMGTTQGQLRAAPRSSETPTSPVLPSLFYR